jgi:hypothetical protein
MLITPKIHDLVAQPVEGREVEVGLVASIEIWSTLRGGEVG